MEKMKLATAMLHISRYFDPIVVSMNLVSPTAMDMELTDPMSKEAVKLCGIPCRSSVTTAELYQLINLIESQAKARNAKLFNAHFVNKLNQG